MRTLIALAAFAAAAMALAPMSAVAAPTRALESGVAQTETLVASGLSTSFYIDVGASSQTLKVELSAANTAQDVDLLLRFGSPFPDTVDGAPPSTSYLNEVSQYASTSSQASESIAISRSNKFPVQVGRWYIAILNFSNTPASVQVKATASDSPPGNLPIQVVFDDTSAPAGLSCNVAGWNDTTAKSPVGGNTGTTLGQQRRNAMLEAARLLGTFYKSDVPIKIQACWNDLGGTSNSATLASAISQSEIRGIKSLQRAHTWYTIAAATKQAGASRCQITGGSCDNQELFAQFNTAVDGPQVLGSNSFYYGLNPNPNNLTNDVDFLSVALHEISHSLGFKSDVNVRASDGPIGEKLDGFDDIFSSNLVDVRSDGSIVPYLSETNAERADALVAQNHLRWADARAVLSSENIHASEPAPDSYIWMYTPNPIAPGSTQSHIGFNVASQLMHPTAQTTIRVPGLSQPMLEASGWSREAQPATVPLLTHNTLMFDPAHDGHGIDFARVVDNIYFLVFYTYDAAGTPEWYIAIGPMIDGIFMPARNANGSSLVRYKFVAGGSPQQQPDPSIQGDVRLDFNGAKNHPACNDGRALPNGDPVAVMTWTLGADQDIDWCMQSLIGESARGTPDYTGTWYSGTSDSGWGFSFASFDTGTAANRGFFSLIYFPDANGFGRWGYLQTNQLGNDTVYTVKQRRGYCRTCSKPAGNFVDVDAGTMSVKLLGATQENVGTGNKVTLDVTFKDAPGGNFKRTNSSMTLLSVPAGQ